MVVPLVPQSSYPKFVILTHNTYKYIYIYIYAHMRMHMHMLSHFNSGAPKARILEVEATYG